MSEAKKSPTTPTKSEGSPKNSIRILKTDAADDTSIEVKVGGDSKVAVEVNKIEDRLQNGEIQEDETEQAEEIQPITDEEVDEIVDKYAKMDKNDLQKYMDFFWSVDTFHFGAFTVHQLAYRLRSAGYTLENRDIAVSDVVPIKFNEFGNSTIRCITVTR